MSLSILHILYKTAIAVYSINVLDEMTKINVEINLLLKLESKQVLNITH